MAVGRGHLAGAMAFGTQMKPTCHVQASRTEGGNKHPTSLSSHSPNNGLDPPVAELYQKSEDKDDH